MDSSGCYLCYILLSADGRRSYAGCTNCIARRLRQHNGEIAGGARATRSGRPWRLWLTVGPGFSRRDALRFEWRLKSHRNWHRGVRGSVTERRLALLAAARSWAAREGVPVPAHAFHGEPFATQAAGAPSPGRPGSR